MNKKYSNEIIRNIICEYSRGKAVALLCAERGIPRSTIYFWIKQYRKLKSDNDIEISYQDYHNLKRKNDKLEDILSIIKVTGCSLSAPLKEKLSALEKLYELGQYSVHTLCDALDVSRGTFYNHVFRRQKNKWFDTRREDLREQVRLVFDESEQRFGSRKIRAVLVERGFQVSVGYVAELMSEMSLKSVVTYSKIEYKKQVGLTKRQNKLFQQFDVSEPNQVWVSDTTCFKLKDKYYYICVIIDMFSRKVVAHGISQKHSTYLTTSTMKRALNSREYPQNLTFHSDQGSQYISKAFRKLLYVNNVVQSLSRAGKPHDNAVAESFFSFLKKEELYRVNYKSERELCGSIDKFITFYNTERPHGSLSYKVPDQFEKIYHDKKMIPH